MGQKKKLIGATALALALAGGGVAGALIGTPLTSGAQQSTAATTAASDSAPHAGRGPRPALQAAATAIGISVDDLRTALQGGQTIVQVAQAHGVDPNTVIEAMVTQATTHLRDRITAVVNGDLPKHRGRGIRRAARLRAELPVVATALGVTPDELKTALQSGQSIADIAAAHNVPVQTVIDTLVADATAKIDAKVASGGLTAERAAAIKANLTGRITALVNHSRVRTG